MQSLNSFGRLFDVWKISKSKQFFENVLEQISRTIGQSPFSTYVKGLGESNARADHGIS